MKKVKIHKSFEQAEQDALDAALQQTPTDRLRETVELILRTYNTTRAELMNRKRDNKIRILSKS